MQPWSDFWFPFPDIINRKSDNFQETLKRKIATFEIRSVGAFLKEIRHPLVGNLYSREYHCFVGNQWYVPRLFSFYFKHRTDFFVFSKDTICESRLCVCARAALILRACCNSHYYCHFLTYLSD